MISSAEITQRLQPLVQVVNPLAERFVAAGFRLYLVGGIVRDLLLGQPGYDVDLTTDARPADIKRCIGREVEALWTQGERFGTIGVRLASWDLEITTHRAEAYDPESRKPSVSFGDDLDEDLSRRDFTINAIAIELPVPVTANDAVAVILDPYGGVADLTASILRTPLSPDVSFNDDPLRLMRAARFAARFKLAPEPGLEQAAFDHASRLSIVSPERVAGELERLLALPDPSTGLALLDRTGVLDQAILGRRDLADDVGRSTLELAASEGGLLVRRAGLLSGLGSEGADEALRSLRYSNQHRRDTVRLLTAIEMIQSAGPTDASVRRAAALVGKDLVDDLRKLAINQGDAEAVATLDRLSTSENLSDLDSPLSGAEILTIGGLEPGPRVGEAQKYLQNHRLEHGPMSHSEAVELLSRWLRQDS